MFAKIYATSWLLLIALAAAIFLTGNLNAATATLLGFPIAALIFGFMIGVLPWWADKKYARKRAAPALAASGYAAPH